MVPKDYRGLQGVTGRHKGLNKDYRKTCRFLTSMFLMSTKACFFKENVTKYFFSLYFD